MCSIKKRFGKIKRKLEQEICRNLLNYNVPGTKNTNITLQRSNNLSLHCSLHSPSRYSETPTSHRICTSPDVHIHGNIHTVGRHPAGGLEPPIRPTHLAEGSRHQHTACRLSLASDGSQQRPHLRPEAGIEHRVRLVEDHQLDVPVKQVSPLCMLQNPLRSSDQYVYGLP